MEMDWEGGTQGKKVGAGEMGLQCLSRVHGNHVKGVTLPQDQ